MPSLKKENQITKRAIRRMVNENGKKHLKEIRLAEKVALGKTVIVTEKDGVKSYAFPPPPPTPPTPPRLSWLSGKTFKHGNPSKNRPGRKPEQVAAFAENASRTLAKEIEKALEVPTVDGNPILPSEPMVSAVA